MHSPRKLLGLCALPACVLLAPVLAVQTADFSRLASENTGRAYRLLADSYFALGQTVVLMLGALLLSATTLRGAQVTPLGLLAGRAVLWSGFAYAVLGWALAGATSPLMNVENLLVLALVGCFAREGSLAVGDHRSPGGLRLLAALAGLIWVVHAGNASLTPKAVPYGQGPECVALLSPSYTLFRGFIGWQVWVPLATLAGFILAATSRPAPARALTLLLIALSPLVVFTHGTAIVPAGYLAHTYAPSVQATAPWQVAAANSLGAILPLILFYYWLSRELARPAPVDVG